MRQIVGGVHIDLQAVGIFCTLGLNVSFGGQASFLTNGHCSDNWGASSDATNFWQAFRTVSADLVGSEGTEAQSFGSATDSRCPTTALRCKWSDVDVIAYPSGMVSSQAMGYFARTTTRTQFDSNLVVNSGSPHIPITSKTLFPFVNDIVDKVGARTGWTSGPVTGTCATVPVQSPLTFQAFYLICTHSVNASVNGGDSGSGVFVYDSGSGNASWAGQLMAGSGWNGQVYTTFYFSPLNNIQAEFGNIPATMFGT